MGNLMTNIKNEAVIMFKSLKTLLAVALAGAAVQAPVQAADTEFFKGEDLTYIVATNAGGGYDAYGRLVGKYLEKHLEADNVVIRNLPGAGHVIGTNTLWEAKPNGLTIGTFNTGLIYGQILGREAMRFDLKDFEWIGKAAGEPRALVVSAECDIKTPEDLINADKPVKFAVAGIGSASYTDTQLLAEALDLNVEAIAGFDGTEGEMSMMRGEVCAQVGSTSSFEGFVNSGYGSYLMTVGGNIDGVANAMDYAKTEKAKSIISLIDALAQLGRVTAAPPGTPQERVDALRAAYKQALEDPDLLAEAEKMGRPIDPAYGEDVKELVVAALNQSPETVAIIAKAVEVEAPTVTVTTDLLWTSDDGREIEFMSGDEKIRSKVSGSRTSVKVNGKTAKRSVLEKGMNCEIEFAPGDAENEPKHVVCNS
jgi:tripartite-type tricarboxylate transporter receptor subunit TctC